MSSPRVGAAIGGMPCSPIRSGTGTPSRAAGSCAVTAHLACGSVRRAKDASAGGDDSRPSAASRTARPRYGAGRRHRGLERRRPAGRAGRPAPQRIAASDHPVVASELFGRRECCGRRARTRPTGSGRSGPTGRRAQRGRLDLVGGRAIRADDQHRRIGARRAPGPTLTAVRLTNRKPSSGRTGLIPAASFGRRKAMWRQIARAAGRRAGNSTRGTDLRRRVSGSRSAAISREWARPGR